MWEKKKRQNMCCKSSGIKCYIQQAVRLFGITVFQTMCSWLMKSYSFSYYYYIYYYRLLEKSWEFIDIGGTALLKHKKSMKTPKL